MRVLCPVERKQYVLPTLCDHSYESGWAVKTTPYRTVCKAVCEFRYDKVTRHHHCYVR